MSGQCGASGRHAFALVDTGGGGGNTAGTWRYASVNAYTSEVAFLNGSTLRRVDTRARPHVIIDPATNQPIALSTGLKETAESGYVWTLVQPLGGHRHETEGLHVVDW